MRMVQLVRWFGSYTYTTDEFDELFETVGKFMSNPHESFYQGLDFMSVIRRKSDGNLFGFEYWEDISKHGEPYAEPNGEDFPELEENDDYGWYVFKPVESFTITGYKYV